jgi:hypothetical protein
MTNDELVVRLYADLISAQAENERLRVLLKSSRFAVAIAITYSEKYDAKEHYRMLLADIDAARTASHQHTDACWEPDSGCDMGRNENFVKIAGEPT